MQSIIELLNHYGYIVLFVALMVELIGFPLPGELIMTYCGFLVYEHNLNWFLSIFFASLGIILGASLSYSIGKMVGATFFEKYGSYIHLDMDRQKKIEVWFNRYGNKLLIIAYFIPGAREITGYFSGTTKLPYKQFALNSYLGAIIWSSTFISLGKILGPNWHKFHSSMKKYLIIFGIIISIVILIVYFYKNYKRQIIDFITDILNNAMTIFHSLGKIKIAISGIALVFLGLLAVVIGLIQDYLAKDFHEFDTLVTLLIDNIFKKDWSPYMHLFNDITSLKVIIPITILLFTWIILKSKDKLLELRFMFTVIWGGEVLQYLLRVIFRRLGPLGLSIINITKYTFPSKESLIAVATYGFLCFMIVRYAKKNWLSTISIAISLLICILAGLAPLFFQTQYPSDVFSGYVFGGMWLSLNIVLLEIYRIMPTIKN